MDTVTGAALVAYLASVEVDVTVNCNDCVVCTVVVDSDTVNVTAVAHASGDTTMDAGVTTSGDDGNDDATVNVTAAVGFDVRRTVSGTEVTPVWADSGVLGASVAFRPAWLPLVMNTATAATAIPEYAVLVVVTVCCSDSDDVAP